MNKKTTLLGLLGLAAVSGAGYLYTTGQASQLPQQIGQYLPETVRDYLPASFSPKPVADKVVENEADIPVDEPLADEKEIVSEDPNDNGAEYIANNGFDETLSENPDQNTDELEVDHVAVELPDIAGINSDIIGEIEQSVSQLNNTDTGNGEKMDISAVDDNISKEIQKLEQQLSQANNQLGELDSEKLELEDKFQNVLKKNRSLAVKLKGIDDQLKVNMK